MKKIKNFNNFISSRHILSESSSEICPCCKQPINTEMINKHFDPSNYDIEQIEDLSFKFKSKRVKPAPGVISHEIITIEVFNLPDGYKQNIKFPSYHLIFGDSSMAIFDAFGVDETAGLTRQACQEHLDKLESEGKSEAWDGAFIAGLCNWSGDQMYQFFNAPRCNYPGYLNRMMAHESLHMARMLITMEENEWLRINIPKDPKWWEKEEAKFTVMDDSSEEYFAETQERITAIAYDRWEKIKGMIKMPSREKNVTPPTLNKTLKPSK